jgi:UTP--glucose-1-phosphate uridylyltransferase
MKKNIMKKLSLVIPAAGIGSRLFPVTWAVPKELLPINNKPALHYVLMEALNANINTVICIHSPRKESLISYLTYKKEQKEVPLSQDEEKRLDELDNLNSKMNYHFKIQSQPNGVGDAIFQAFDYISDDFFCIAYPDDILIGEEAGLFQLIAIHEKYNCSTILIEKVNPEKIHMYGVIGYFKEIEPGVFDISNIVEKPNKADAKSLYGIIGRYIMHKDLFLYMKNQNTKNPCNIKAYNDLIMNNHKILGVSLKGKRYDIGTLPGWLDTIKEINFQN